MFDDWTKQLNELKLEVESGRRQLEARQNDVESVVTMVIVPYVGTSNDVNLYALACPLSVLLVIFTIG